MKLLQSTRTTLFISIAVVSFSAKAESLSAGSIQDENYLLTIGMTCPSENNGVLEIEKMNLLGQSGKTLVTFEGSKPTRVYMIAAEKGGNFHV